MTSLRDVRSSGECGRVDGGTLRLLIVVVGRFGDRVTRLFESARQRPMGPATCSVALPTVHSEVDG